MDVMATSGSKNITHHMQPGHVILLCTPGLAFKREKGDKPLGLHMHGSYAIYLQKKKSWAAPEQLEPCPGRVPCVFPDALLFLLKLCQAFFRQEGRENNPWPHLKPFRVSLPRESSDSPQPRGLCTVHFALSFREATQKWQKSTKYDKNLTRSIFLSRGDGNNELCRA